MMNMGMIVNPDHMSQKAVDDTLDAAEARHYSGVISPHGWMDPRNWPRIWKLGGMAFPGAGSAAGVRRGLEDLPAEARRRTTSAGATAPTSAASPTGRPGAGRLADAITYPFKSIDGATTVQRQRTGKRTFDYTKEGVAHYGLYADWLEEVAKPAGRRSRATCCRGSEAYLEMWERAEGIPASRCAQPHAALSAPGSAACGSGRAYKPR